MVAVLSFETVVNITFQKIVLFIFSELRNSILTKRFMSNHLLTDALQLFAKIAKKSYR